MDIRKYPLYGYITGVLMHTTSMNQHFGDDETLKRVFIYIDWLCLTLYYNVARLLQSWTFGSERTQDAYFSLWGRPNMTSDDFCPF